MVNRKIELNKILILATATFLSTLLVIKSRPAHQSEAKAIVVSSVEQAAEKTVYKPVSVTVEDLIEISEPELPSWVTDEDIELLARVVMSEASVLSLDGKIAVCSTIINRFYSSKFPNNIEAIVMSPYQYSTQDNGEPNEECYLAVDTALRYNPFPEDMYYFRTGHYHSWAEDYCQIGNTYFSCEPKK